MGEPGCVHMCVYAYAYVCACMCACARVCMYLCAHMHVCICMHCVCAYTAVWVQVCLYKCRGTAGHESPCVRTPTLLHALQGAWLYIYIGLLGGQGVLLSCLCSV